MKPALPAALITALFALTLALSQSARAQGQTSNAPTSNAQTSPGEAIFLHGNQNGAMPCAACHGAGAQGNPSIGAPKLAGLPAALLTARLNALAHGQGSSASMQYIANALSPAEISAVTLYIASLK